MSRPKNRSFAFYQKKSSSVNRQISEVCSKRPPKKFCTSPLVLTPDPSSPNPSTSSAVETSDNKEEDSDDPEPADGDIQTEYSTDLLYSPNIGV
jgi:hypothetical protein